MADKSVGITESQHAAYHVENKELYVVVSEQIVQHILAALCRILEKYNLLFTPE